MKTENQIKLIQTVAPRRNLAVRTAVTSLASARIGITLDPSRRRLTAQTTVQLLAVLVTAGTLVGAIAFAQSAKDIRVASPYIEITNEPAPKLIVDPPLPEALAQGIFWAQYRVENLHIVPVFGAGAVHASPRVGHLHVIVDDLPWWWADASDNNTIDIAGLPPGQHKVKIQLVGANHHVFPGQVVTLPFTVPDYDRTKVYGHEH